MQSFDKEIRDYINHIESVKTTFLLVTAIMQLSEVASKKEINAFLESKCIRETNENGKETYSIPSKHRTEFAKYKKKKNTFEKANVFLPRSFVVSLVSLYDAYLGKLIKTMFYVKPEKLNASQKNISFNQLMEFTSIEEARKHVIEKEVETVLRESHSEQFKWLENKLSIPLTKGLDVWPIFIEVTERRNIFVHCDGIVTSQYLTVCENHGVKVEKSVSIGSSLNVTEEYFINSYNCLFEIGFKLGQVLWRKLQPEDIEKADENLIELTFELIANEEYQLAVKLLEFAINTFKRLSTEDARLRNIINLGQAYKWLGKERELIKLLSGIDWSALAPQYRLANAVLLDNFQDAVTFMKKTDLDIIDKDAYKDWPLFKKFRGTDEFKMTYQEMFGEEFINEEEPSVEESKVEESNFEESDELTRKEIAITKEEEDQTIKH